MQNHKLNLFSSNKVISQYHNFHLHLAIIIWETQDKSITVMTVDILDKN